MKRLNPETGKIFELGETRPKDGYLFWGYAVSQLEANGYFTELWRPPVNYQAEYHKKHREVRLTKNKIWRDFNRGKFNAIQSKRRSAKLQRTPNWLTTQHFQEIAELFIIAQMFRMYTGEQYHVDHIVPLQGKNVSGLHVPWNLQVIPAKQNLSKNNKHD